MGRKKRVKASVKKGGIKKGSGYKKGTIKPSSNKKSKKSGKTALSAAGLVGQKGSAGTGSNGVSTPMTSFTKPNPSEFKPLGGTFRALSGALDRKKDQSKTKNNTI